MSTPTHEPAVLRPLDAVTPVLDARTLAAADIGAATDRAWPRRILVASDGSPEAGVAILAAQALADRSGASVEMVAVYSPRIPMPPCPGRSGFDQCEVGDRIEAATLLRAVRKQRRRLRHRDWPLRLEVGNPCAVIVRSAKEMPADLVMLGIGPRNPEHRSCDIRTAGYTAQYVDAPLYAVSSGCESPSDGIVVLSNGEVHPPTLRAAVVCVTPGGRLSLALPRQAQTTTAGDGAVHDSAREIVARACGERFADQLEHLSIERVDIDGDMLAGVLHLAEERRAQLLAVPIRGEPGSIRAFLPNLADALLLSARCSVLVVPDGSAEPPVRERLSG